MSRVAHHPAWPGARRGDQVGTRLRGRAHWSNGRADARPVLRLCCTTTTRTYSEELNFRVEFLPCAGDEASMPCPVARCAPLADEKMASALTLYLSSRCAPGPTVRTPFASPRVAPPVRAPQVVSVCMSGLYVINKTASQKQRRTCPPRLS